jgi:hypothetical protein
MMLTNLADILRGAGLPVVEIDGWKTRSADGGNFAGVYSIICHWTATNPAAKGDYPTLSTILNGNGATPGPLSQLGLGRNGTWYVIAAGVCWHAGVVDVPDHNNYRAIGIEAEYHPDQGGWPDVQQRSYERGCAALAKAFNVPVSQIQGHYEVARPVGRKSDPNTLPGGMAGFRQRVSAILNSPQQQEDDDMARVVTGEWKPGEHEQHLVTFPSVGDNGYFGIATGWQDAKIEGLLFIGAGKKYLGGPAAFTLRSDDRKWWKLPKGTDQVSIQYTAGKPIAYSVELG